MLKSTTSLGVYQNLNIFCANCCICSKNTVYHIFKRNFPSYSSGCDWVFFTISQSLPHRLLPQWKPCNVWTNTTAQRQHTLARFKPGTGAYRWIRKQEPSELLVWRQNTLYYNPERSWHDLVETAGRCRRPWDNCSVPRQVLLAIWPSQ